MNKTKYFDENNHEISQSKFERIRSSNKLLDVPGDSIHHKKLTVREKRGKITNRAILESMLEKKINQELDATKPIIIIYYPGKDPCNSSGTANKESIRNWHSQLAERTEKIAQTKPIYVYKDAEGLDKYDDFIIWHKDPQGIVENLFFKYHYPCSSFVVISKDGNYISYFGEFPKDYVWKAAKKMSK